MNEPFDIIVHYMGKDLSFNARLIAYGYSYRILVSVDNREVIFEPDEERKYRALLDPIGLTMGKNELDVHLLKSIAETLENILS
jgi:hypothetical protein